MKNAIIIKKLKLKMKITPSVFYKIYMSSNFWGCENGAFIHGEFSLYIIFVYWEV